MTSLHTVDDLARFDELVGERIAAQLAQLAVIEHDLDNMNRADSVAAMTRTMALDDERDELCRSIATALLQCRQQLDGPHDGQPTPHGN